jgi:Outer membrane protein beta-barrel domain
LNIFVYVCSEASSITALFRENNNIIFFVIFIVQTSLMKKIAFFLLLLCGSGSFAQNGFFIQPQLAFGNSNALSSKPTFLPAFPVAGFGFYSPSDKLRSLPCYDAGVSLGYHFDAHWEITAGLASARSGYVALFHAGDFAPIEVRIYEYMNHVMLPLAAGYRMNLDRRFFITPAAGISVSYNYGGTEKEYIKGDQFAASRKVAETAFSNTYHQVTAWATARVTAGYKVSSRLNVTAGPAVQYMLNSVLKSTDNSQHNYSYAMAIGVQWSVCRPAADDAPDEEADQ